MCILPNFNVSDLKGFEKTRKRNANKVEAETVELLISEQILENQS